MHIGYPARTAGMFATNLVTPQQYVTAAVVPPSGVFQAARVMMASARPLLVNVSSARSSVAKTKNGRIVSQTVSPRVMMSILPAMEPQEQAARLRYVLQAVNAHQDMQETILAHVLR